MALTNMKYTTAGTRPRASGYLSGTYTAATVTHETTASATSNAEAVASTTIAAGVMTIKLGFVPVRFKLTNITDRITQEWFQGMNAGDFLETVAAGTRTLETDDKLTIAITGTAANGMNPGIEATGLVTITFDGGAATDNDTMVWEAE